MKPYKLTEQEEAILEIIAHNAKAQVEDIAKQVGLSEDKVKSLIKKLEDNRIIVGYQAKINWQRIREHEVTSLIEVKVAPERRVGFDSVAESIYRFNEVKSVTLLSGSYDLLVVVEGENLHEVAQFVADKLASIKGVQSTVSHFMLKKYKEDGVVLVDQSDSKRLPIAP